LPSLDVHTIGAGGGSIARIDPGGALVVGPASAGAVPGPACYGRGGAAPTVTDADLVLGRLPAALAGLGPLDVGAARDALARAGVTADGVGMLGAPRQREVVRSWTGDRVGLDDALHALADGARGLVGAAAVTTTALDVRYVGQSHEITVPSVDDFHAEHARRNGYSRPEAPVEIVALRARARIDSPLDMTSLPELDREVATGPAVIAETDCTIWVPDGWRARRGAAGALVLER
jgi:N-methylhydantoinase A/oxoprolinase/acetone carboxylase beta subunit